MLAQEKAISTTLFIQGAISWLALVFAIHLSGCSKSESPVIVAGNPPLEEINLETTRVTAIRGLDAPTIRPKLKPSNAVVFRFAVEPTLPQGLRLNKRTGELEGQSFVRAIEQEYTITALTSDRFVKTRFKLQVKDSPLQRIQYSGAELTLAKGQPVQAQLPTVVGGLPDEWVVSPRLPNGLILDLATGVISGSPVDASARTPYTIHARNGENSVTTILTIEVRDTVQVARGGGTFSGTGSIAGFMTTASPLESTDASEATRVNGQVATPLDKTSLTLAENVAAIGLPLRFYRPTVTGVSSSDAPRSGNLIFKQDEKSFEVLYIPAPDFVGKDSFKLVIQTPDKAPQTALYEIDVGGVTEIRSTEDLKKVLENPYGHFRMTTDLDLNQFKTSLSTESVPFFGIFDGNDHELSRFRIRANVTSPEQYFGLFTSLAGEVRNLKIRDFVLVSQSRLGGVAGRILSTGKVVNVRFNGILLGGWQMGGLTALNDGEISGSAASGMMQPPLLYTQSQMPKVLKSTVTNAKEVRFGGLSGRNEGQIDQSESNGTLTAVSIGVLESVKFGHEVGHSLPSSQIDEGSIQRKLSVKARDWVCGSAPCPMQFPNAKYADPNDDADKAKVLSGMNQSLPVPAIPIFELGGLAGANRGRISQSVSNQAFQILHLPLIVRDLDTGTSFAWPKPDFPSEPFAWRNFQPDPLSPLLFPEDSTYNATQKTWKADFGPCVDASRSRPEWKATVSGFSLTHTCKLLENNRPAVAFRSKNLSDSPRFPGERLLFCLPGTDWGCGDSPKDGEPRK